MRGKREEEGGRRGASGRVACGGAACRVVGGRAPRRRRRLGVAARFALLLFPLSSFLLPLSSTAQTRRVEILNADFVEVTADSAAGTVRRLSGNVRLRQDTTALRADRAVYYETRGEVVMTGAVRIVSGRDTLTAAEVVYDSNSKRAVATGAVRVGSPDAVLFAPRTTYDSRAEVSTFSGGGRLLHRGAVLTAPEGSYSSASRIARATGAVRLVDSTGVLTARRGLYDTRIQRADFGGDVRLVRPDARLNADSVVYFRRTERARAYGRVALERVGTERTATRDGTTAADSTRRTFLFGESLLYDGVAETARVRGTPDGADPAAGGVYRDPLVVLLRADTTGRADTTLARAPRLDAARVVASVDTLQVLTAAGGARLWSRRLASVADSLRFTRTPGATGQPSRDRLALRGTARPRVWADGAQLTGDSLDASATAESLDSLVVVGSAFAARVDSTVGRLQQIAGGRMLGRFRLDSLRTLSVWPTAEALAFRATPDGRLAGAEWLSADSLAFRFVGGEIREVAGVGGVEGTSYGPTVVPTGVRLSGYAFDPADAPASRDLLDGWEAAWLRDWLAAHPDWAGPAMVDAAPPDGAPSDEPSSSEAPADGR